MKTKYFREKKYIVELYHSGDSTYCTYMIPWSGARTCEEVCIQESAHPNVQELVQCTWTFIFNLFTILLVHVVHKWSNAINCFLIHYYQKLCQKFGISYIACHVITFKKMTRWDVNTDDVNFAQLKRLYLLFLDSRRCMVGRLVKDFLTTQWAS